MKLMFVGIDCGKTGAVAAMYTDGGAAVFDVRDTPVYKVGTKGNKHEYDVAGMKLLLKEHIARAAAWQMQVHVIIERQTPMPKVGGGEGGQERGSQGSFYAGFGYGLWLGMVTALDLAFDAAHPASWKPKMLKDMPPGKEQSIIRAKSLFPQTSELLKFKKNHGRAEAILLCEYGRRFLNVEGQCQPS